MSKSAHSQRVPRPRFRWGTRVLMPAILAGAFVVVFAASVQQTFSQAIVVEAIPVIQREAILRETPLEKTSDSQAVVQAAGWIEPDPFPTHATTLTNGNVQEVLFLEGDSVRQGDVLARLNPDDAKLQLERAQSELRAAEETWEQNVDAKLEADAAKAAVSESRAMLDQARAELKREQALLKNAELLLGRIEGLVEREARTQQDYDTASAETAAKAAEVRAAQSRIAGFEAVLARRIAEEAAALKRLELRTEDRRRLDDARISLAEAELRMERMEIKAPIDGVVMERLVHTGSMLMAFSENAEMAHVASLYDPSRLQVRVDVPLADAAKVGRGQRALVTVEVLPGREFEGTVSRVTNQADIQKNTLEVKVALREPSPLLKPDMLARVRFLAVPETIRDEPAPGLSVFAPPGSIANGVAWVVSGFDGEEGVAAKRSVSVTDAESEGWVEVESGLSPGDLLITPVPSGLKEGQRVAVGKAGRATHGHD